MNFGEGSTTFPIIQYFAGVCFNLKSLNVFSHLHFVARDPSTAVHSLQGDGVELTLVQVHHRNLCGLVLRGLRCSENKLKIIPTNKDSTKTK